MILALDAHYSGARGAAAGVLFAHWGDAVPDAEYTAIFDAAAGYAPGALYRRELPGLLTLVETCDPSPSTIVVDGYVWLGGGVRPGLGKRLHDALGPGAPPVVGVAKTLFRGASPESALLRGRSRKPLFISAVGMELGEAKAAIAAMAGPFRIPTLLARADQLARAAIAKASAPR